MGIRPVADFETQNYQSMTIKINCEFNDLGAWCKCKQVKRKWYQIGGRGCMEYPDQINKCPYKTSGLKTPPPPPIKPNVA